VPTTTETRCLYCRDNATPGEPTCPLCVEQHAHELAYGSDPSNGDEFWWLIAEFWLLASIRPDQAPDDIARCRGKVRDALTHLR
jgi:hypothetical protein